MTPRRRFADVIALTALVGALTVPSVAFAQTAAPNDVAEDDAAAPATETRALPLAAPRATAPAAARTAPPAAPRAAAPVAPRATATVAPRALAARPGPATAVRGTPRGRGVAPAAPVRRHHSHRRHRDALLADGTLDANASPMAPTENAAVAPPTQSPNALPTRNVGDHVTTPAASEAPAANAHPRSIDAPAGTPLAVRPNRALNLAPASSGREDWKLIVGVGGLAVGIFIWKRRSDAASSSSGPELKIVRRAPLQHHGELLVVEVGGQRMLLGATSNSVQHLATLEGADESAVEHAISSVPAVALATPPSTVAPPEPARDESAARFEAMLAAARSVPERDTLRTPPRRPTLPREAPPSEDEVEEQVRGLVSLGVPR